MKKRILFILHFPPPVHGSSVVGLMIKESKIINASYDCRYVNLGTSKTMDEIGKNALGKIFCYISILWQVARNIITCRPSLCYLAISAKGLAFYKDALVVILLKLFRIKLVYHLHGKGVYNRQDNIFDNLLYRLTFKNADVILLSPLLYTDIQKYVASDAVQYCPNGIRNFIMSDQLWDRAKAKGIVNILFLSNMFESKGVFVLLEACKILQNKSIKFQCTFVGGFGDINEQVFHSKVHQLGIKNYVIYVGKKFGSQKEAEFAKADIFTLPTFYPNECFPLVLLEAMKHCLPIISTLEGAIPEIVEDEINGFLIPKRDSQALADKLEILINNPKLRHQMGTAGRVKYEQKFTLQHFEDNLNVILSKCLLEKSLL